MKYWICLILCFVATIVSAATITGNVQTVTSSPYDDDNILFIPKSTPWANGNNIVQSTTVRAASSNLNFSISLLGGVYLTKFTSGDQIYIYVPINDTNTYSFTFLSTNLLTMALINNPRVISSQVLIGTNGIIITTNNAGTSSETITISVGTIFASATNAIGNNNGSGTNTVIYGLDVTNSFTLHTNSALYYTITPEMFGADPTGATDSRIPWTNCLNYCHIANNGINNTRVVIRAAPTQTYNITSGSLFLQGGEIIEGNAVFWSGTFANTGTGTRNTFSFQGTNGLILMPTQTGGGVFGVHLKKISFQGDGTAGGNAILFGQNVSAGVQGATLEDLSFVGFDTAIRLTNTDQIVGNKLTFYNCTNGIISTQGGGINANTFKNVNANCYGYAAQFFGAGQMTVSCQDWDAGNGGGIYFSGVNGQVNNCNIEVNRGSGFELVAADSSIVTVNQGLLSVMRSGVIPLVETNSGYFVFNGVNSGQVASDGNGVQLASRNNPILSQWVGQSGLVTTNFALANSKNFLSQTSLLPAAHTNLDSRTFTYTNPITLQNGQSTSYTWGADKLATTVTANTEKWLQWDWQAYEGTGNRRGILAIDDSGPGNRVFALGQELGGGGTPDFIDFYTSTTLQWRIDNNGRLTYFSGPGTFRCNNVEDDAGMSVGGVYTNSFQGGGGGTAVFVFTNLAAGVAPNAVYPNGSFMSTSNGTFFVRSNNTWVQK